MNWEELMNNNTATETRPVCAMFHLSSCFLLLGVPQSKCSVLDADGCTSDGVEFPISDGPRTKSAVMKQG